MSNPRHLYEREAIARRAGLVFENAGLIDIRAATTMGINAKAAGSAIGFFGTGLKYSIACILRWGGKITIYRGTEAFEFAAKKCDVRGREFEVVCMNGAELGFVTDYGKKWEPWQVYRELYTNTKDEGGTVARFGWVEPRDGFTVVAVECDKLEEAYERREQFILSDTPDYEMSACGFYERPGRAIFYQNLCVQTPPSSCLYTYNLKRKVELSEDRTLKNAWDFDISLALLVDDLCNSPVHHHHEIAKSIMLAPDDAWEHQVHFGLGSGGKRSEAFFLLAEQLMRHHSTKLNHSIQEMLLKRKPLEQSVEVFAPSAFQQSVLNVATEFCETIGFRVSDYPIICAERLGDGVLGLAHDGRIYVTRQAFELGTKMVASTLIEEFIHLRDGVKDFTRQMQEILFNRLITLAEEHVWGRPL